ncbi:MAG: hypothetical protein J6R82_02565 [Clostridia bacterium]|nr:hypothetical protein [Clostridia bacterium]
MNLVFQLQNKKSEDTDTLFVSIDGQSATLSDESPIVTFEIPEANEVNVEFSHGQQNHSVLPQNPVARFFARLLMVLLSPLIGLILAVIYFADNDGGIKLHQFFTSADPFVVKKTFRIKSADNTAILVAYTKPKYSKEDHSYSVPDILLSHATAEIVDTSFIYTYDRKSFRHDFALYHYPAYTVIFLVILALNLLMAVCLYNQIVAEPIEYFGVIAMGFCCAAMLALLVAFIYILVATLRLYRKVDRNLQAKKLCNYSSAL